VNTLPSRLLRFAAAFLPRAKREAVFRVLRLCHTIQDAAASSGHELIAESPTIGEHQIPAQYFLELSNTLRTDPSRYATWPSLQKRCEAVRGNVCKIVGCVLGFTHSEGADRAGKLGVAIELTRILRDLKADWDRGKLYLPLADMAQFRYSERDLAAGTINENFADLIRAQVTRARALYREACEAIPWLADDGSRLFAGMIIASGLSFLGSIEKNWRGLFTDPPQLTVMRMIRCVPRAWRLARQ
jgi:phytoene/squalene synthetase